ncbi:family 8 glycosyl transferase [Jimgerdemannia flammicorona]|uniref:Family 8 glycosyl transferase n=2 Tax=Jimgerdemannia flammicorona TaxID=994334 RepID=A0A433D3R3_9FUNG|nr:family 8 glycosyl transferase [Jimgerdemannia flammicorona]RUS34371.1 family 8 glycosyl transferase [Jimgerdemannia flammicorona]
MPVKAAWVTLLTRTNYTAGVQVLVRSLQNVQSQYPLVVLYTPDTIPESVLDLLRHSGCITRPTQFFAPEGKIEYIFDRYADNWTKFRAWELDEYDRVILVDADMLVRKNMDELMTMTLQEGWIAACHACTCNAMKIKRYPANWIPENCAYAGCDKSASNAAPPISRMGFFNAGLVILKPSKAAFQEIVDALPATTDPNAFLFAEENHLSHVYKGRWIPLPYIYNATKTLFVAHGTMWDHDRVKNMHYNIAKPWDTDMAEAKKNGDQFYELYTWWWSMYAECKN